MSIWLLFLCIQLIIGKFYSLEAQMFNSNVVFIKQGNRFAVPCYAPVIVKL